jgi:hypothetical protein
MAHVRGPIRPRLEAGFGVPERQNRWTVAFRPVLVLPQLVVVLALGIAALVLVVLGWLAALVTGRMPESFARFLAQYLSYGTRVSAYASFMLDAYPPFSFEAGYPVNIAIRTGPVRRVAVLFRIFLVLPALLVVTAVSSGAGVCAFFIWLIVLVKGSMPPSLFDADAAANRFGARVFAYAGMLTSKYPGELLGDARVFGASSSPPVGPPPPPPLASVAWEPADEVSAPAPTGPPAASAPPVPGQAPPASPSPAGRVGPITLSKASKRILVLFIVVGVISQGVRQWAMAGTNHADAANAAVMAAHGTLASQLSAIEQQQASCAKADLACVQRGDRALAAAFTQFARAVASQRFPSSQQAAATALLDDTRTFTALLNRLASDASLSQYSADQAPLVHDAMQVDSAYQRWLSTTS